MTPRREQGAAGSPQEWLAHAESDLNLAQLAKSTFPSFTTSKRLLALVTVEFAAAVRAIADGILKSA